MRDALRHRGPDDAGAWCHEGVAFGHRRLSIIDVAGGHQPLANEDGTVWVAFNGEIYNFEPLMTELKQRGHCFKTRSDTEVLVHAYEEWGDGFVARLNGMFAFSLCDTKRHRLLLARDHFGIKPLFYATTSEGLFWASEIKSVLEGAKLPACTSQERVSEYLTFRYCAGGSTFFEGVRRLPPAHYAVWENGALRARSYWSMPTPSAGADERRGVGGLVDQLTARLREATETELVSDVPLGAFCSGGLDSGLITGFAAGARREPTHTFSVGFSNPEWDESALALANARQFGVEHHVITLESADFMDTIRSALWHHDEPLSHPNTIPFVKLSQLAREHVTVVLTGEGSDELFGGYPRYHLARMSHALSPGGARLRTVLAGALELVPDHRAKRAAALLPLSYEDALILNSAYGEPDVVARLTDTPVPMDARRELVAASMIANDPVATLGRYELRTYLSCLLDRMDRATMAASLEARVPFLDVPLATWALSLPSSAKLRGKQNKVLVRELARRMLPPQVASARKSGFGLPIGDWLRGPARSLVDSVRDPTHPAARHFNAPSLARFVQCFRNGAANDDLMWLIANVYLWHEIHCGA